MYALLIDALAAKAIVKRATKPSGALNYLSTNTPTAIIITDPGIIDSSYSAVLEKVISYVRGGGIAILAGHFSSFVRPADLDRFFRSDWKLPWGSGDYHRTTVSLNQRMARMIRQNLPESYSQKAVFLKNVERSAALYLPTSDSWTETLVFPSEPVRDLAQVAIAFAPIEEGWLG